VPKDVAAKVDEVRERMLKGYSPFVGPIADAKGEVRIPAGTEMDTNTLYVNWRWPMQGITGLNV
jgi:basic membrane protein A and related proteins